MIMCFYTYNTKYVVMAVLIVAVFLRILLHYSNAAYDVAPLKFILAINKVHRFHHLNTAEVDDVNFALFTTLNRSPVRGLALRYSASDSSRFNCAKPCRQ